MTKNRLNLFKFTIDFLFFGIIVFLLIALVFLGGCMFQKPSERITVSGTQPVVIEQDYRNENGNIRYFSKVEIYPN